MDTEEDTMDTASEASCGLRMTLTLSSPIKAREEGVETPPKDLAGERIQKVAMVKSRAAESEAQTSTSRQSAPTTATEAEVQAQAHQPPSPDLPTFRLQSNLRQVPAEAIALKLAHIMPSEEAIVLDPRMIRRRGETPMMINL